MIKNSAMKETVAAAGKIPDEFPALLVSSCAEGR
jgi:hypothetical protein